MATPPPPPRPKLISYSPSMAKQGDTVRIRGELFSAVRGVRIGGIPSIISYRSETELWVTVPALTADANPIEVDVGTEVLRAPTALRRAPAPPPPPAPPPASASAAGMLAGAAPGIAASVFGAGVLANSLGSTNSQGRAIYGAVSGVGGAAAGAAGNVFGAGANIVGSGLGAVLSPFGQTGNALAGIAGAGLSATGSLLTSGIQLGGNLAGGAAGLALSAGLLPLNLLAGGLGLGGSLLGAGGAALAGLGSVTGGVGSVAGGILGVGGSVLGGLGGLVSTATGAITKVFETIAQGAQSVIKTVGDGLGKLGELAGSIFSGLLTIGQDVLNEARNIGRAVRSIGFSTGIGDQRAAGVVNSFAFAGVSPQALGGAFGTPQATLSIGLRARMLGLPDPTKDPEGFLLGGAGLRAQAARGGIGGAIAFNGLVGPQLGGAFGEAFSQSPQNLRRNFALARSFQLPGNIGDQSRDLDAVSIAATALANNLKVTLGGVLVELLPQVNRAFSWIIENKKQIVDTIVTVGKWLTQDLPVYILDAGSFILKGVGSLTTSLADFLVNGFQSIGKNLLSNLGGILKGVDTVFNGFRQLAATGVGVGTALGQFADGLLKRYGINPNTLGTPKGGSGGASGGGHSSSSTYSATTGVPGTGDAFSGNITGLPAGAVSASAGAVIDVGRALNPFNWGSGYDPFQYTKAGWSGGYRAGYRFGTVAPWTDSSTMAPSGQPSIAPTNNANPNGINILAPQPGRKLSQAFADGRNFFLNTVPESNLAGNQAKIADAIKNGLGVANDLGSEGGWLRKIADWESDRGKDLEGLSDSWKEQMLNEARRNADASERTANHTQTGAERTADLLKNFPQFLLALSARMSATLAEDAAMNILNAG